MSKRRKKGGAQQQQRPAPRAAGALLRTDPAKEAALLDKVEAEVEESPEVPEETQTEVEAERAGQPVEDHGVLTATRVKMLWDTIKAKGDGWDKARAAAMGEREELEAERAEYQERLAGLETREAAAAAAEAEIEVRRSAARAGFAADRTAITREAVERRDKVLADAALLEEDARSRAEAIVAEARDAAAEQRAKLTEERQRLADENAAVLARSVEVDHGAARLMAERTRLEDLVRQEAGDELVDLEDRIADQQAQLAREKSLRDRRESELAELRAQYAVFDDPAEAQRRIGTLEEQVADLRQQLVDRPAAATAQELKATTRLLAAAENRATELHQLHSELNRVHQDLLLQVGDRDVSDAIIATLTTQKETLTQEVERLGAEWKQAQAREDAKVPFPACTGYDADPRLRAARDTRKVDSLRSLAREIQARMASSPNGSFYYSDTDVRLFLAGLAASRLHLLQGISGTGKTSLPREFFQALAGDGAVEIVEVQAGWRDKDDLFGFYNAFEKRFAESEFTKALYRALLPANKDRPMVIVLDEMNLAHPEQYFGTMLSTLENAVADQPLLPMLTSGLDNAPAEFIDKSQLPLPPNVWFVGTANHDETTVAFADKTYDRAHVQELPARYPRIDVPTVPDEDDPVSFVSLQSAFQAACIDKAAEADRAKEFLEENLRGLVGRFGVGWGNRLRRQTEQFVPVVVESGGTLTEGVDHLFATKLVRKLENRFDIKHEDLFQLADDLTRAWSALGDGGAPTRSVQRILDEAHRLRGRSEG